jgi:hypothetical protein
VWQVLVDQSAIISSCVMCAMFVYGVCCKYCILYADYRHHNCGEPAEIIGVIMFSVIYIEIDQHY